MPGVVRGTPKRIPTRTPLPNAATAIITDAETTDKLALGPAAAYAIVATSPPATAVLSTK
ncbi:hypothetical protein GCM10009630_23110 [Kribbella jejuensis]